MWDGKLLVLRWRFEEAYLTCPKNQSSESKHSVFLQKRLIFVAHVKEETHANMQHATPFGPTKKLISIEIKRKKVKICDGW